MYEARQHKNLTSRTLSSREWKVRQSFHNVNSRNFVIVHQRIEDLNNQFADLLNVIRIECENLMWGAGNSNSEVQIGIIGTTLIIGYNADSNEPDRNKLPTPAAINALIAKKMFSFADKVKINKVRLASKNVHEQGHFHAEIMIIRDIIKEIIEEIIQTEQTTLKEISIRGKKFTCVKCKRFIKTMDDNVNISRYLKIHTPHINLFATPQRGENSGNWENPLSGLDLNQVKSTVTYTQNSSPNPIKDFIDAIDILSQWTGV